MSDEINRRNAEGVMHTLRKMENQVTSYQITIDQLSRTVSDLISRVAALENIERMRAAARMGHGPTE